MIKALLMSKHYTPEADEVLKGWLGKPVGEVRALFCTNASDTIKDWGENIPFVDLAKEEVRDSGFDFDDLDLREFIGKNEEFMKLLKSYDVIFITGGDSSVLLDYFEKTGLKDQYAALLKSGLIHVGFSAGAIIFSKEMKFYSLFRSDRGKYTEGMRGLGLFPYYLVPHYSDKPKYTKLFEDSVKKYPEATYLPLVNKQGIVMEGKDWRII
ncbi:hypothetical protein GF389_03045 [Candidatus Dojkabacteria bacterium]|nr:hypothetical protein [Candidatus Dojkabacteria bacterium]